VLERVFHQTWAHKSSQKDQPPAPSSLSEWVKINPLHPQKLNCFLNCSRVRRFSTFAPQVVLSRHAIH